MAALSIAIEKARRAGATRENREAHKRAALRLEEVFKSSGMADELDKLDRPRNLKVESAFAEAFQAPDLDSMRDAVVRAFMEWERDEKGERTDRHNASDGMTSMLVRDNPVWIENQPVPDEWIDGQWVPNGMDGAA